MGNVEKLFEALKLGEGRRSRKSASQVFSEYELKLRLLLKELKKEEEDLILEMRKKKGLDIKILTDFDKLKVKSKELIEEASSLSKDNKNP